MDDTTSAAGAPGAAAEAVRALNHLTMRPPRGAPGREDLADVYAVAGVVYSDDDPAAVAGRLSVLEGEARE